MDLHYGRKLALLEMGEDTARSLGVPVGHTRGMLILAAIALSAIALSAVATAAAGPIAFVALAARPGTSLMSRFFASTPHVVRGRAHQTGRERARTSPVRASGLSGYVGIDLLVNVAPAGPSGQSQAQETAL
ncbi:iron chelate uptake ABC transporter family permease subunit [Phytohabitans houttuyneae]|uniref:Uncharacterized protein n=1 Tax=Phytohabitans houttuyneae TaxID=1076126 RepID=A0A6V8KMD7_9ACTN|nr:iron chelate uptake ABC transporter family permease subunit [Phytohabitans houttuyneae]GFJ83116.1 hypothetical protein Phou_072960 [Phytohabitans houttuyneae]